MVNFFREEALEEEKGILVLEITYSNFKWRNEVLTSCTENLLTFQKNIEKTQESIWRSKSSVVSSTCFYRLYFFNCHFS